MVAFLEKSTGSEGFHQVIDFLTRSHICYALTKKPELDDQDGITSIPNSEIFEQLALMGYHTDSNKLTFQKGAFSPQWRFLIHNILHCLSPKKTAWEQFSSNIAAVVICLATNRKYNFSRMIFEHMVSNISSPHKFLMYPRFIQICLDMQRHQFQQHTRTYHVPSLSMKVFNNMKRPTKDYSGQEIGCIGDDVRKTKITYSSAITKLILRVKKLEARVKLKIGKARRQARVVLSDDEDIVDDSSKQGRKLSDDQRFKISKVMKLTLDQINNGTASEEVPIVSTAEVNLSTAGGTVTYTRRSAEKRLSLAEAIRLEEQMNEEQRAQIARDAEIARQWDEEERNRKVKRAMAESKSTKKIDWNDPSVWDFNQHIEPMEHETEKMKSLEKMKSAEKMEEDDVATQKEMKEVSKETGAKRKKEEVPIEVESISTKFPIVDWKTCVLTKTFMYYQVFRGDGSSKNYKILSEMLEDFDRQDVEELYRLFKERYSASRPEGFDLML
ncbi:hypothetical protein Tco_1311609 [Tanacetum coccineum]